MGDQIDINSFLNAFSSSIPEAEKVPVDSFMNDYLEQLQWTASGQLVEVPNNNNVQMQMEGLTQLPDKLPTVPAYLPNVSSVLGQQGGGIVKEKSRLEQQREINRKAQQRFRQRNRARQVALQQTYGELSNELDELKKVSEETNRAQEKVNSLEERIKNIESELEEVQKTAQNIKTDENLKDNYNFEARDAVREMYSSLCNLRIYLRSKSIDKIGGANPTNIEQKVSEQIMDMVMKSAQFCVMALQKEGPVDIWAIVQAMATHHRDLFKGGVAPWSQKLPQEWIFIASNLQLTDQQIYNLLICRQEYHDRMEKLLEKRQQINYKIISMLLPGNQNLDENSGKNSLFSFFTNMSESTKGSQTNSELDLLMKSLRQNLSREQMYYSKFDEVAFTKLLTPLQAAWFMLESLPEHCDILALVNAVYEIYGNKIKIEETDGKQCGFCDATN